MSESEDKEPSMFVDVAAGAGQCSYYRTLWASYAAYGLTACGLTASRLKAFENRP